MKLAAIQMVSGVDVAQNIQAMIRWVKDAATQGAKLVLLPEYWGQMGMNETDKLTIAEPYGSGYLQQIMGQLAKELGIYLVGGTIPLISPVNNKVYNSMLTFSPDGVCISRYDKVHLFSFQDEDNAFSEVRTILAGKGPQKLSVADWDAAQAICYDLRFPEFFRQQLDFDLILLPAAFTYTTGKAHWLTLLTARAIENQCYLLASAQGGVHENGRKTFGHSVLIDPWGEIISHCAGGEGIVSGTLDRTRLNEVREKLPALAHRNLC